MSSRSQTHRLNPAAERWLIGSLALVIAPHLTHMPLWLSLTCGLVLAWRLVQYRLGWPFPGKALKLGVTVGALLGVIFTYRTLLGQDAGTALLAVMLCLKLLEMRSERDARVLIILGYFMVITAFLYSQSIGMGLYMLGVVLALTAGLIAVSHQGSRSETTPRHYLRLSGEMVLQAVPMMVILFLLFPRTGTLWGTPTATPSAVTGLSGDMTLASIGELSNSEEVAFRAQFSGEIPLSRHLYWRGPVLWNTDGTRWTVLGDDEEQRLAKGSLGYEPLSIPIDYSITLEPHGKRWILGLDFPALTPVGARITPDYQILAYRNIDSRRLIHLRSVLVARTGPLDPLAEALALRLPEKRNPKTIELGRTWQREGRPKAELVERALRWFREEKFYYTRRPPILGIDPVDSFLFDSRRGFCEHYAAAFTVLMRAAGVPSRVVTGYQGGEINSVGDYLVVRQSDAHAWAEVYLDGKGWTRVDPTAVIPAERVEVSAGSSRFKRDAAGRVISEADFVTDLLKGLAHRWDAANYHWNRWVLGYSQFRQQSLLKQLGLGGLDWKGLIGLLVAGVAAVFIAVGVFMTLRRTRSVDPVVRAYASFCERLARKGIVKSPGEGPTDFARRVTDLRPDLEGPVWVITRLYNDLRYGKAPPKAQLDLRRAVAAFRP